MRPRLRDRKLPLVLFLGLAFVAILWHRTFSSRRASFSKGEDASGFGNVAAGDEEDFAVNSALNTVKLLDQTDFVAPPLDLMKPSLILHVGPIKTGVEALARDELSQLKAELDIDDYVLLPQMAGLHETCQRELSLLREDFIMKRKKKKKQSKKLEEIITEFPCWKEVLDTLAPYNTTRTSVIVSDELLSHQLISYVESIGPAVMDWITIRDTLMRDWNVIVVVSYRRFFEWLPSAKASAEQAHKVQRTDSAPRLARWPGSDKGMVLEPLFPHFVRNNAIDKLDVPYTPRIVQLYQPFVSATRILNLYTPDQSVRTSFVCDILDHAEAACAASKTRDERNTPGQRPDLIASTSRNALWNDFTKSDQAWFDFQLFDELAVVASQHNYIRTKFVSRTTATETTQYYVETYRKETPRKDLPLVCPNVNELNHFLDQSLTFERQLLPQFVALHKDTAEKEHRQSFAEVGNGFCSINMRKILRQVEWRTFFRHLTTKSAARIQAGGEPGPARKMRRRGKR